MDVLETTGVLAIAAIFMIALIFLVKRGYRRLFTPLRDERCIILARAWERKPIPEENKDNYSVTKV